MASNRTAIGNEWLVAIADDKVMLRVRADDTGGKRVIAMPGEQFVGRRLQHVLQGPRSGPFAPRGFKRIRHYGLLGHAPTPLAYHLSMNALLGTVVGGKIVVEGLALPEGTVVTVLTPADDTLVKLPPHLEKELLDAIDEADQEVGGAGPEFLEGLKRYG